MSLTQAERVRRKVFWHFENQRGRCIWCGCNMFIGFGPQKACEPTRATYEHFQNRHSAKRTTDRRSFAACYGCNSGRGVFDDLLRKRGADLTDIWIAPDIERLRHFPSLTSNPKGE